MAAGLPLLVLCLYWLSPAPNLGLFLLEPLTIVVLALGLIALGAARVMTWANVIFALVIMLSVWRILVDALSHYAPIFDDAFMFVRYVQNLFDGGVLTWNPGGAPTYGLTSPLYALVVAVVMLVLPEADPTRIISLASLFSGVAFLAAIFTLLWRTLPAERLRRRMIIGFIFVMLSAASGSLSLHFSSGMDTTFAMFMLTLYLIAVHHCVSRPHVVSTAAAAVIGALLFWTRPELTLYAGVIPLGMFLLAADARARWQALRLGLFTLAGLLAILTINTLYFGVPLPLPFYIKSGGLYNEPVLIRHMAEAPRIMLGSFLITYLLLILPTVGAVLVGKKAWMRQHGWLIGAVVLTTFALTLYYLLFVLQIMFYVMRFYHHILPAVIWLAGVSLVYWSERLKMPLIRQLWGKYGRVLIGAALAGSAALLLSWLLVAQSLPRVTSNDWTGLSEVTSQRPVQFDLTRDSFSLLWSRRASQVNQTLWFGLSQLAQIDAPLVIATTEVGRPSITNRQFTIVDMAGLNNPDIVFNGFSAERLLTVDAPDWIYVPHIDYTRTTNAILTHPEFARRYDYYPAEQLGYVLAVAIRRDSAEYERLTAIMQAAGQQPAAP